MKKRDNRLQAKHAAAWAAYRAGRLDEAQKIYTALCHKYQRDDNAWMMMGIIDGQYGNFASAEQHLRRAMQINSKNSDACMNHGLALLNLGNANEAVSSLLRALEIVPGHVHALLLLGNAYARLDQLKLAENAYRRLLRIDPSNVAAYGNLANILAYQGRQETAVECYRQALRLDPRQTGVNSNLLLCLHYSDILPPDMIFAEHLKWADRHCSAIRPYTDYLVAVQPDRVLRIGYVTPDLRGHSVAYFLEPLLRYHDREHFQVYCYVEVRIQDEMTKRLWACVDVVRDTTRLDDAAVAHLIHDDRIDILIDLAGHTENNRLPVFAYKPAPVQMTYLGYPDTTGLDTVDYRITDGWADPPGTTEHLHSEELLRLENGFLCFSPPTESPPVSSLPALERGYITFGSFNVQTKITPVMLDAWANIMSRLPTARLLIKNRQLSEPAMQEYLLAELAGRGIAGERVALLGTTSKERHMATYGEVDIALDSYPYNGTTTTCDTLWMGIPVITLAGSTHVSRVGASLLARVGLDDLVCPDTESYVTKAVALSGDPAWLAETRRSLRSRMQASSLCDAAAFIGEYEDLLRSAWRQWCEHRSSD